MSSGRRDDETVAVRRLVRVLSGRYLWRVGTFHGWTSRNGEPLCAEVDLLPTGRAKARRARVTTIGHLHSKEGACGACSDG